MSQIAFVGCAHVHTHSFAQAAYYDDAVSVDAVWDHNAARAKEYGEMFETKVVDDPAKIAANEEIEAVVICSETRRHKELAIQMAKAGKHLFIEKPLGLNAADAWAICDAVEKAGVMFQTGFYERGEPAHRFVREQIAAGTFGKVTRVRHSYCNSAVLEGMFDEEFAWMIDPKEAGGGGFADVGAHALDILMWLMGDVESVTATVGKATDGSGGDEFGEGMIRFKNGAVGTIGASWVDVSQPIGLVVDGTEGHAHVVDNRLYVKSEHLEGATGAKPWTDLPKHAPHAFSHFLAAVGGEANVPLVTVREAAQRGAVMEAMYRGAKEGKWVEPVVV